MLITTKQSQEIWLNTGYNLFAHEGPAGLKVEVIARVVQKSKSSFYHHFADLEVFTGLLLDRHLHRSEELAIKERQCQVIDPELIDLMLAYKVDLLFNRQLRVYRDNPAFHDCLERSNRMVEAAFLDLWVRDLGLQNKPTLARQLYEHSLDNFYLCITEQNLNKTWLTQYFEQINTLVAHIKQP